MDTKYFLLVALGVFFAFCEESFCEDDIDHAVVAVWAKCPPPENPSGLAELGCGSGVIIKQDPNIRYVDHVKSFDTSKEYAETLVITWVATAKHVVNNAVSDRYIEFYNGAKSPWQVSKTIKFNDERDAAVVICWAPENLPEIPVDEGECKEDDELCLLVRRPIRTGALKRVFSPLSVYSYPYIYSPVRVVPGDSGGPVLRNGRVVGVINGGWFWINPSTPNQSTWPMQASMVVNQPTPASK